MEKMKQTDIEFIKIQDDISNFIRKMQKKIMKLDKADRIITVKSYLIFFVVFWTEIEMYSDYLKKVEKKDNAFKEHAKFKIEEVMNGDGPESITYN
jgi:hypothetical protein